MDGVIEECLDIASPDIWIIAEMRILMIAKKIPWTREDIGLDDQYGDKLTDTENGDNTHR